MSRLTGWSPTSGIGVWSVLGPVTATTVSHAKPGWIGLDGQHGLYDDRTIRESLACHHDYRRPGACPLQRRGGDRAGHGCRRPGRDRSHGRNGRAGRPGSGRSPVPDRRHSKLGPFAEYRGQEDIPVGEANSQAVCAVMTETRHGLDHLDQIVSTAGVDMVFVGAHAGTSERTARLTELGFELVAATTDRSLLLEGVTSLTAAPDGHTRRP
jgi:4-hydroxy-2-oxoheptanedioate aldolase